MMLFDWLGAMQAVADTKDTLRGPVLWILAGMYHDYPDCCIEFFCTTWDGMWERPRSAKAQIYVNRIKRLPRELRGQDGHAGIPCPMCLVEKERLCATSYSL